MYYSTKTGKMKSDGNIKEAFVVQDYSQVHIVATVALYIFLQF